MIKEKQKMDVFFNYTQSTIDYVGMASWSMISRCGQFVAKTAKQTADTIIPQKKKKELPQYNRAKTQQIKKQRIKQLQSKKQQKRIKKRPLWIDTHERLVKLEQLLFQFEARLQKLDNIETKLQKVDNFETRLQQLEKYGVAQKPTVSTPVKKRKISKEQNALLKQIVEANKLLRHSQMN